MSSLLDIVYLTKQADMKDDSARQADTGIAGAQERVEHAIIGSEDDGLLVRQTAERILAALAEYGEEHGVEVLLREIGQIADGFKRGD